MKLSIIVPAYNEEKRLTPFLDDLVRFCRMSAELCEIIVVDDGSTDKTSEVAARFGNFQGLRILRFEKNGGKGRAVKEGMLAARGAIRVFTDADGSYPPQMIAQNLRFFDEGYDVVIGSRSAGNSFEKESFQKKSMRRFFSFFIKVFLFRDIADTQCGFKMFSAAAAQAIFSRTALKGFGMDLEILYLAKKMGFRLKEAPVECIPKEGSKIRLISDSLKIFLNIFEIRLRHG